MPRPCAGASSCPKQQHSHAALDVLALLDLVGQLLERRWPASAEWTGQTWAMVSHIDARCTMSGSR
jgi:hypothetical protein